MLQCHFSNSILSKHFVVYESVRTSHLVFHPQFAPWCDTYLNITHLDGKRSDGVS